jgi:hypothetical protein
MGPTVTRLFVFAIEKKFDLKLPLLMGDVDEIIAVLQPLTTPPHTWLAAIITPGRNGERAS